jgi:hypothetical protein
MTWEMLPQAPESVLIARDIAEPHATCSQAATAHVPRRASARGWPARSAGSGHHQLPPPVPRPSLEASRAGPVQRPAPARAHRCRRRGPHSLCDGAARCAHGLSRPSAPSLDGPRQEDASRPTRYRPAPAAGALGRSGQSPPLSTIVCATWRWVSSASIVTIRPSRTTCGTMVSTAVIAWVVSSHGVLGQRAPSGVRQHQEEGRPGRPLLCGAAQRFAIQRPRALRRLRRCGQTPDDTVSPGAQGRLARIPVHGPQDRGERGGTGGARGEAEGLGDARARMVSPCGAGTLAAGATPHRPTRQGASGGERMTLTTWRTQVG